MRALLAGLLAASIAGCGTGATAPVQLLTYDTSCHPAPAVGLLVTDPKYGTALLGRPVAWPSGFSGRDAGSEVEVLDGDGKVVAVTGKTYEFAGTDDIVGGVRAFVACAYFVPQ